MTKPEFDILDENFSSEAKTDYGKRLSEQLGRVAVSYTQGNVDTFTRALDGLRIMVHPFSKFDKRYREAKEKNEEILKEELSKVDPMASPNSTEIVEANENFAKRKWEVLMDAMQRAGFLGAALTDWEPKSKEDNA